jgi:thiamine pyrophosphate-dependent acetolactate synthase large subunit-like protein
MAETCGAEVPVRNLKAQAVKYVFGAPAAEIDRVFDSLMGSAIETEHCGRISDGIPETAAFLKTDLSRDPSAVLDKAEKAH